MTTAYAVCGYADCTRVASHRDGEYEFCGHCWPKHVAEFHPWTRSPDTMVRTQGKARCGTRTGLQRHRREKSIPCEDCLEAERIYQRERKRRRARLKAA